MKKYPLTGLSPKAIKCLPEVLDKAGYAGKYELHAERNIILIATTAGMIRKFYLQAESKAQGEPGRLITIKKNFLFSTLDSRNGSRHFVIGIH